MEADPKELTVAQKKLKELQNRLNGIKGPTVPIFRELAKDKRRNTYVTLEVHTLVMAIKCMPDFRQHCLMHLKEFPHLTVWTLPSGSWIRINPLTPRVTANRFWEKLFGIGLVATSEEFGSQGELPSHPKLLDWLATEMIRLNWDVKAFIKLLVTSETYKQSSHVTDKMAADDPANRLLSRGPRIRLSAEMVRDQALAVSGLLSSKMYGAPVKPPQPDMGLKRPLEVGLIGRQVR